MRKGTIEDKKLVIKIITDTFLDNPAVLWTIKKTGDRKKHIRRLANYAFYKSLNRDGVFISDNNKGVALIYQFNKKSFSFREFFAELNFAFRSIGIFRIPKILKREKLRNSLRPKDGNYIYFWFMGVEKGGNEAGQELKRGIFNIADKLALPIYLETSVLRNKTVYEKIGFQTFEELFYESGSDPFWMMKREPNKKGA